MHSVSQPVPQQTLSILVFDVKGWLVMAFMIALDIRTPATGKFYCSLYTGLSLALMATGGRFILLYWKGNKTGLGPIMWK